MVWVERSGWVGMRGKGEKRDGWVHLGPHDTSLATITTPNATCVQRDGRGRVSLIVMTTSQTQSSMTYTTGHRKAQRSENEPSAVLRRVLMPLTTVWVAAAVATASTLLTFVESAATDTLVAALSAVVCTVLSLADWALMLDVIVVTLASAVYEQREGWVRDRTRRKRGVRREGGQWREWGSERE